MSNYDDDDESDFEDYTSDVDDDQDDEVYPCPECGNLVYDDASLCPSCGYYFVDHQPWFYAPRRSLASYLHAKPLIIAIIIMLICVWFLAGIP